MKKILFILPTLSAGGAENYALRFIKHNLQDFEFHVLSVNMTRGDLYNEFKVLGLPIFHRSIGYFNPIRLKSFFSLLKKNNYDSVCTFNGNFGGLPLTIAKYAGVKNRIAFYRRSTDAFRKNKLKLLYNNFVNGLVRKNATSILSNSEAAFKNFHGDVYRDNRKYKIIKNGVSAVDFDISISKVEARAELKLASSIFLIGHIGRFDPAKNHKTIFQVIRILKERHKNFAFLFCGKDTDSDIFLNLLKLNDIEDVVISLGLRNDLPIVYRALDVFYFPSITEGQPNALIEAMISGLPVVTSNIPPILEALPSEAVDLALEPSDFNAAGNILKNFINKDISIPKYKHQDWAKKNFDSIIRFNEFRNILEKK